MIPAFEVNEAARIVFLAVDMLLATSNNQIGRAGSDLRRACGDVKANANVYIITNVIGSRLSNCFSQARTTGATMDQFNRIQQAVDAETVTSLVATLIKQACVAFSLQQMSNVLASTIFTSREDVERVRDEFNAAFDPAEEIAADEMAQTVYFALVSLHAAVTFHLYETARPLPQMLNYQFSAIRPTLVHSYRLYADASRADQLREENKVVHPAFAPRSGRAVSF
jgi:prophage DNA circulation protein